MEDYKVSKEQLSLDITLVKDKEVYTAWLDDIPEAVVEGTDINQIKKDIISALRLLARE